MSLDNELQNADTLTRDSAPRSSAKRKRAPLAVIAGGFFAVAGTVAPDAVARIVRRMLFTPTRRKPQEEARSVLASARTEKLTVGGETVFHYTWGEKGPSILLVHGWGGDVGQMTAFVEPLRRAGYQVFAIDFPAHGRSTGSAASVKHFEFCIATAAKTYGPYSGVIAHSLGAAAVTYALSRGLRCDRAVFLGPVSRFDSVWKYSEQLMNLPPKVMPLVVKHAERWLGLKFDEMEPALLAPSLSTPLLIVHDRGDRESPFEDGAVLAEKWSDAKLVATDQLGHKRALRDPSIVQQVVAFVTGQNPTSVAHGNSGA